MNIFCDIYRAGHCVTRQRRRHSNTNERHHELKKDWEQKLFELSLDYYKPVEETEHYTFAGYNSSTSNTMASSESFNNNNRSTATLVRTALNRYKPAHK
jgi:hypothetical protein